MRAFHTACNGRPGPVVIAVPEDMLIKCVSVPDAFAFKSVEIWPGRTDIGRLQKLLCAAERPIVLAGGSRWSEQASAALMRFAEHFALPVATSFRRAHLFDALHDCYAGNLGIGPNPKLLARVKGADLVLLIGGRMSEMPSQSYTVFDIPEPQTKLVHVHSGAQELGRVYHPHLAINASPSAFCSALEELQPPHEILWKGEADVAQADYIAWSEKATPVPGAVNLGEIVVWLRENLPRDAILANGAGNFAAWVDRLPFPTIRHASRANLGVDGLRFSGRLDDENPAPRSRGGLHHRRRRFSDDRVGFCDRRTIRIAGDRSARRQRPVWYHPHAPGARIPRPRNC